MDTEKMVKSFVKKHIKIIAPIAIVLVLIAGIFLYFNWDKLNSDEVAESETPVSADSYIEVTATPEATETPESAERAPEVVETSESEEKTPEVAETPESEENVPEVAETPEPVPDDNYVEYRFRNEKLLSDHYYKHGVEMGFESMESYEKAASDVINNPEALTKTEKEDGDIAFYVVATNEFVILSTDGYIRTYFNPSAGKAYFDRQ